MTREKRPVTAIRSYRLSIPLTGDEKQLYEETAQMIAERWGYSGAGTVTILREILNEYLRDYRDLLQPAGGQDETTP